MLQNVFLEKAGGSYRAQEGPVGREQAMIIRR
jgi:hypothetical protein